MTVTAKHRGTGVANLPVVWHDHSGTLRGEAITDAAGSATAPLPHVVAVALDLAGAPRVTWAVTGAAGGTDRVVLLMVAQRATRDVEWFISLPADAASPFTLPAQPAALAALAPTEADSVFTQLTLLDVDGLTSAQVRADAARWARNTYFVPEDGAAPFRLRTSSTFRD